MLTGPVRPRRVLIVAYHFPPLAGSSGIQRTLRFVQHLPSFGWQPVVLTVRPMAYERTSADMMADIPPGTVVRRALALDNARHLSIGGRHIRAWSRPDRWRSWRTDGVRQGLALIDQFAPQVIFSTYPIATAHRIGAELQSRSGLPWVADFRDPMAQDGYPADPLTWRAFRAIEERAIQQSARCLFTTPGAVRMYSERYPEAAPRMLLLENGYDEESFVQAQAQADAAGALSPGALTIVHSGIVYPSERDPRQLFLALQALKRAAAIDSPRLVMRFRAPVHEALLRSLAEAHGLAGHVEVCPPLPYRDALSEMLRADALLLMQASNCNDQVPAKAYEYLRARRPLLCLSDPKGDTVAVLRGAGITRSAALDDASAIGELLAAFVQRQPGSWLATEQAIAGASRAGRTALLAAQLDELGAAARPAAGRR